MNVHETTIKWRPGGASGATYDEDMFPAGEIHIVNIEGQRENSTIFWSRVDLKNEWNRVQWFVKWAELKPPPAPKDWADEAAERINARFDRPRPHSTIGGIARIIRECAEGK